MNAQDLKDYVIIPTLEFLDPEIDFTISAVWLVLGTAAQESHLHWLDQTTTGPGPAYGPWQMEGPTFDDHMRWLSQKGPLYTKIRALELPNFGLGASELAGNLFLGAAMCRVHYWRRPGVIPSHTNIEGMAKYWKQHYNTLMGKGKVEEFVRNYKTILSGVV